MLNVIIIAKYSRMSLICGVSKTIFDHICDSAMSVCHFNVQELVSEKLKTQQMNNDLEKLTNELEKIGLNKERLLQDEQSSDDRYYTHMQPKSCPAQLL